MKYKRVKILGFLLTLAMVIGLLPGMSLTAYAASYEIVSIDASKVKDSANASELLSKMEGFVSIPLYEAQGWSAPSGDGKYKRLIYACSGSSVSFAMFNPDGSYLNNILGFGNLKSYNSEPVFYYPKQVIVAVTGVSLNKNSTTLTVGASETLTATVGPEDATDKTVTWSTSDASVAKVADGVVTAVGAGTATITATATNGTDSTLDDKTAACTVTVHTHSFTYSVDGATITATCSSEGCPLTDNKATLTIEPSSSGGGTAELSGDVSEFGVSDDDITYQAKDSTGWNDIDSSKITNQGFYKASIKFGTLTASITYGVNAITKGTGAANGCDFKVPTVAYVGAKIKPELTLATGYEVKKITVTDTAKNVDVSTSVGADTEGFTMPEYNIIVSIEFGKINYTVACSSTNGTLTANNATAQYEDTVTLTATPNSGYELKSFTVKDSANSDVDFTTKDNTATFTMPASNITATATFEAKSFGITISSTITNGTLTAAATTAKFGSEVTLTVSPNTGYEVSSVTVKQNTSNTSVTVTKVSDTSYKFTVPADNVTVSAEFAKRNVSVSAQLTGNSGTTCDAVLMDESYEEISDTLTKKLGEKFILKVVKQEGYGFNFTFSTGDDANEYVEEFSQDKYLEYIEYARENEISLPSNMYLFQVTMPSVAADSMNVNVTFSKVKNFTILYQTTNAPKAVWCKFIVVDNGKETSYVTSMKNDAAMGDGTAVWSLKTEAAFDPTKVAFLEGESNANIDTATVTDVSVLQSAPTDSDWTSIANNGGKFCVIGGNTKTFVASFVADGSSVTVYDSDTVEADTAENSDGVIYRIAVCLIDSNGNVTTAGTVTAPTNTYTKTGYNFAGWRGFEGTALNLTEKIYNAGDSISINKNTTVSAVWNIKTASITLNRNGGTGGSNVSSVTYGSLLTLSQNPTKKGYTFDGWTVSETVTENGTLFARGSLFDFSTPITTDLKLTAQWKHVHSYTLFRITDFPELKNYHKYDSSIHVDVCGCASVKLTAHKFDSNGKCSCGYTKPSSTNATLNVSYGQWANGKYTVKMQGLPETTKKNQEVSIFAPKKWGNLQFSRWQYTTDNTTWADLTADAYASFIIPCNMTVRALYVNPATKPQVNLSARLYADSTVINGTTYTMDNILFNMNYQLPDGYTFVDAGIRLGDNGGIAYYEMKERTYTTDAGGKAMLIGITAVLDFYSLKDLTLSATETYYEEHTNSVLDEMSAETLAKYMYESKPINMEKYPPIYWEAKTVTKGMSGSMATIPPLRFAQKDNGNHYIYGIAYLRYKNSSGKTNTIYTPALPATINNVPSNTVSKEGN